MNQQNLARKSRGSSMGAHEDLVFPAPLMHQIMRPQKASKDQQTNRRTWPDNASDSVADPRPQNSTCKNDAKYLPKMSPLSAVDVQTTPKRHKNPPYPSSLFWLNVYISWVFSLFVVLFLVVFECFIPLFVYFRKFFHYRDLRCIMRNVTKKLS